MSIEIKDDFVIEYVITKYKILALQKLVEKFTLKFIVLIIVVSLVVFDISVLYKSLVRPMQITEVVIELGLLKEFARRIGRFGIHTQCQKSEHLVLS
ncbi:MAG TPA: hypothetical protein DHW87_03865 [Fervidobacterium sp.]|nr:hypothetical protein [Fervidobacterium sp.]HUM75741.1 hypothetical protein [Fervidobacterium sp.]